MRSLSASICVAALAVFLSSSGGAAAATIPAAKAVAFDGHTVVLPRDLASGATILILGFSRNSAATTTAWEKPIRTQLAAPPAIGFYDMPMLAEVPSFIRPLVLHGIRRQVPDVLKPRFAPLTMDEAVWKQIAQYTSRAPDAAYILLVDRAGNIRWQTHEPYSPVLFAQLSHAAQKLEAASG